MGVKEIEVGRMGDSSFRKTEVATGEVLLGCHPKNRFCRDSRLGFGSLGRDEKGENAGIQKVVDREDSESQRPTGLRPHFFRVQAPERLRDITQDSHSHSLYSKVPGAECARQLPGVRTALSVSRRQPRLRCGPWLVTLQLQSGF
jgi:hypothetical protein